MTLIERLNHDMKTAMKNKDKQTLTVIRTIRSSIKNEEIGLQRSLNEEEALGVVMKELKQQKDALGEFEQAGRDDLALKAKSEIAVLEKYLPQPLSDDELRTVIQEAINRIGAVAKSDMGKVMKEVLPKVKGRADGKRVNQLVQEYLQ
ncbi:GatB/YqeY domain-containing protein [Desmospora activa]|uniref:GatB/YqeY domain-containing protein n=1 Tax=Desmospora activa DSM 45169 TaxID=1121389 RepID=A0A2T4ZC77_9BACL|nr:GatB/YqeY domain-containing protein [Desmospora activa]PTM59485.1 hypothetical protein C8J48_2108 [Desmospora activa DSM 45169]